MGTKRILGRCTASAMASASRKSLLLVCTYGFTYCAGINRTSCPCSRRARPRKCDPLQDSMPINCTCTFAVKASSCLREHFLRITTLPVKSSPTKGKTVLPKSIPSTCSFIECLLPRTLQLLEIRGGPSHYLAHADPFRRCLGAL